MLPGPPTTRTQRNVRNQTCVAKESAQRTSAVVANRLGRNRFDGATLCPISVSSIVGLDFGGPGRLASIFIMVEPRDVLYHLRAWL